MPFYPKKKRSETFKMGKIDYIVFTVMVVAFIWAFFFDSFVPLLNETGEPILSEKYWRETGDARIPKINAFAIIGGLILFYEFGLVLLEGKKRGRYLPWILYYGRIRYAIHMKIKEEKELNKKYFDERRKR